MRHALSIVILLALAAPAYAQSAPVPTFPARATVVDTGPAFRGADPSVIGVQGGFALALRPGRSVWLFGDTLLGAYDPDGRRRVVGIPASSAAYADDADWVTGYAGARFAGSPHPAAVLRVANRPADRRHRPLDVLAAGRATWLTFEEVRPTGRGPVDTAITGTGIALMQPGTPIAFTATQLLWESEGPAYGGAMLLQGPFLYLYAGGEATRLARVPADRPDEPGAYTYWTGTTWSSDPAQATDLPASAPILSVRANAFLGGFLMVYATARTIETRFALSPEGPWSAPLALARSQPDADDVRTTGARQVASLTRDNGRSLTVAYSTTAASEAALAERPDLGWPRLLRVSFSR